MTEILSPYNKLPDSDTLYSATILVSSKFKSLLRDYFSCNGRCFNNERSRNWLGFCGGR